MAREFSRTDRVADAVQRILAQLVQFEINDPRVGMVNINDVKVSRDLANAKVYVTFVGRESESECQQAALVLNNAAGYLRSLLAKELNTRTTPRLTFVYDETSVRGQQLSSLIDKAVAEDRAHYSADDKDDGEAGGLDKDDPPQEGADKKYKGQYGE